MTHLAKCNRKNKRCKPFIALEFIHSQPQDLLSVNTDSSKSILCSYPLGSSVTLADTLRVGEEMGIRKLQWSRAGKINQQYGEEEQCLQPWWRFCRQLRTKTDSCWDPRTVTTVHLGQHIPLNQVGHKVEVSGTVIHFTCSNYN